MQSRFSMGKKAVRFGVLAIPGEMQSSLEFVTPGDSKSSDNIPATKPSLLETSDSGGRSMQLVVVTVPGGVHVARYHENSK